MQNNIQKLPLKNGILVMIDPKYRRSEYVDIFNLEIIDAEKKGFKKGMTLGEYFILLESEIVELKKQYKILAKIIKKINGRSLK